MRLELAKYLNKPALLKIGALTINVVIRDYKFAYGRKRFLVTPVAGRGEQWSQKVKLLSPRAR